MNEADDSKQKFWYRDEHCYIGYLHFETSVTYASTRHIFKWYVFPRVLYTLLYRLISLCLQYAQRASKNTPLVSDKGEVFGWGNTEYGQISTPADFQQIATPTFIKSCKKIGRIKDIASGGSFCMVLNGNRFFFIRELISIIVSLFLQMRDTYTFGALDYLELDLVSNSQQRRYRYHHSFLVWMILALIIMLRLLNAD